MMIYSTYTWDLVGALESASRASCKTPATFIDSIRPNNKPEKSKESSNEIQLPTNCIVLPRPTNTEPKAKIREVDLEPSPKRGSDKIDMLNWTHIWIPALREVDLEPSAKRGAERTKVLVSLY